MRSSCAVGLLLQSFIFTGPAPAAEQSVIAPLAARSLLIDVARQDATVISVGDRGHVLKRGTGGDWRQVVVPARVLLTAVDFSDARQGCAVGHDAVVICTRDGGASWTRVHADPGAGIPLLAVRFLDDRRVIAAGAYNLYLRSDDGGRTWRRTDFVIENNGDAGDPAAVDALAETYDLHLNTVFTTAAGDPLIAAEAGRLYRSGDDGRRWQRLDSPYAGSWFGGMRTGSGTLLVFGLRGQLYRSTDHGAGWTRIESHTGETLTAAARMPDGTLVIGGHGGVLLVSRDDGRRFSRHTHPGRYRFTSLAALDDRTLVLTSDHGVFEAALPATDADPLHLVHPAHE